MSDRQFDTTTFHDGTLVAEIGDYLRYQFSLAKALGAYTGNRFVLGGAEDGISVKMRANGIIVLVFANSNRPAYRLTLHPDGECLVHYSGELSSAYDRLSILPRLTIGLPERSLYGWIEDGRVTTLISTGMVDFIDGINYPPGLNCYVHKGSVFPAQLRMPLEVDDELLGQWTKKFWQYVGEGRVARLSKRIQKFPQEVWAVWQTSKDTY